MLIEVQTHEDYEAELLIDRGLNLNELHKIFAIEPGDTSGDMQL